MLNNAYHHSFFPTEMAPPLPPRQAGEFVTRHAKDVSINDDGVKKLASVLADAVQCGNVGYQAYKDVGTPITVTIIHKIVNNPHRFKANVTSKHKGRWLTIHFFLFEHCYMLVLMRIYALCP